MAALGLTMSVKAIMTVHSLAEALSQGYKPLPDPNWLYYLATDIPVGDGAWNHTIQFVNPTPKFASLDVKSFRPDKTKEGYIHLSVDIAGCRIIKKKMSLCSKPLFKPRHHCHNTLGSNTDTLLT